MPDTDTWQDTLQSGYIWKQKGPTIIFQSCYQQPTGRWLRSTYCQKAGLLLFWGKAKTKDSSALFRHLNTPTPCDARKIISVSYKGQIIFQRFINKKSFPKLNLSRHIFISSVSISYFVMNFRGGWRGRILVKVWEWIENMLEWNMGVCS